MTVLVDHLRPGTAPIIETSPQRQRSTQRLRSVPRLRSVRRPGGRSFPYANGPTVVRVSRAAHTPTTRQVYRRRMVAYLVLTVLAVALLAVLVELRSVGAREVPVLTGVVQVHAGESLSQLAGRVAPNAPTTAVVNRIVELNGLTGAAVRTGETLVVPVG